MDKPSSGLAWRALRHDQPGSASQRLRQLGPGQIPLTHDAFHELQPWRSAAHLEEFLVASGVLSPVDKYICSFQRWLLGHLAGIKDPDHVKTIRRDSRCSRKRAALPSSTIRCVADRVRQPLQMRVGDGDQAGGGNAWLPLIDRRAGPGR